MATKKSRRKKLQPIEDIVPFCSWYLGEVGRGIALKLDTFFQPDGYQGPVSFQLRPDSHDEMATFFAHALVDWSGFEDSSMISFHLLGEAKPPPVTVSPSFEFSYLTTRTSLLERAFPNLYGEVEKRYRAKMAGYAGGARYLSEEQHDKNVIRERLFREIEAQKDPRMLSILRTILLTGMIFDRVMPAVEPREGERYERFGLSDGYFGRATLPPWFTIPVLVAPVADEYRRVLYGDQYPPWGMIGRMPADWTQDRFYTPRGAEAVSEEDARFFVGGGHFRMQDAPR